jgi:phosphate transport system protein
MTHYEERLERDLAEIRKRIAEIAQTIEEALKDAIHAVLSEDRELANAVILGDLPINREIRSIDRRCHAFVARHLPSAGHLRFVSSALRLTVELERVGDYAVAISREQVQLSSPPSTTVARDIELLGEQVQRMLNQAMKAFNQGNADLARGTKAMADQVESTFERVFRDLLHEGEKGSRPIRDLFALLVIFNRISRVADQSKNICEETIFAATGETKPPKVYRVLFIDEKNNSLSQLAELYARRAFPESGKYASAGWSPAEGLDQRFLLFLEKHGFDTADLEPADLGKMRDEVDDFHVVVSLEGDGRPHLQEVPFHTVLLQWEVGPPPEGLDQERALGLLEEAYKRISVNVRELMETLRGEEAS